MPSQREHSQNEPFLSYLYLILILMRFSDETIFVQLVTITEHWLSAINKPGLCSQTLKCAQRNFHKGPAAQMLWA